MGRFGGRRRERGGERVTTQLIAQVKQAKGAHVESLLGKRNVVGVGLGYKISEGVNTGELSLIVSVTRKAAPSALAAVDMVPKILDGTQRRAARLAEDIREMRMLRARLAGAIRGTIETHLDLLEGLSKDEDETEMLLEARFTALTSPRADGSAAEDAAPEPPQPTPPPEY